MSFRRLFRVLFKTILWFIGTIGVYLVLAVILSKIVINSKVGESQEGLDIYIITNGVHTDLILPYKNDLHDWTPFVKSIDTKSGSPTSQYVSFGWGDKGFYLETKTWADLKFSTAFNALFYLRECNARVIL